MRVFFSFAPKVSHALMRQYEMLDGFSITWQTQTTYQKIDSLHISPLFHRFSVQAHVIVFAEMIQKRCFSSTNVAFNKYRKWLLAGRRYLWNNTLHRSQFSFNTNTPQIYLKKIFLWNPITDAVNRSQFLQLKFCAVKLNVVRPHEWKMLAM